MDVQPYIIEKRKNWPIARFYSDRDRIVEKLARTAIERIMEEDGHNLGALLNETVYSEKLRVKSNPLKVDPPEEYTYWKKVESNLTSTVRDDVDGAAINNELLEKLTKRYAEEIVGNFNPKTFGFARKFLTFLFKVYYNPFYKSGQGFFWGNREHLLDKIKVLGPLDHIRNLFDKGTVMVLPTHFSNLDSILIGYVIDTLTGMPAFSYGAGLNLYDYELLAYYMSRLGAYKIDRRKKNPIYATTLSQFSTLSIDEGLNSIFFSGGTRSRSGTLESSLKLGLMNTLIDSQNEFYLRNNAKKLIIVPLITSYHGVLEGSSLIDQHLRRTGKSSYLSVKPSKKKSFGSLRLLNRLFKKETDVTLSFGHPIDIFGNELDEEGRSIKNGKVLDIEGYFKTDGLITKDTQRNRVYSRHLSKALLESYKNENVVLTSHLVSFAAFQIFKKKHPNLDIYGLLTLPADYFNFDASDLFRVIDKLKVILLEKEQLHQLMTCDNVKSMSPEDIAKDGMRHLAAYHFIVPLKIEKEIVKCEELKLLYYYHNRLSGYQLDQYVEVSRTSELKLRQSLY